MKCSNDAKRLSTARPALSTSRSPASLAAYTLNQHHQYPDGFVLFCGTVFAPTQDRDAKGQGFTHHYGDQVSVANPDLGVLYNIVKSTDACPPWNYGTSHLMRNLAGRGLLE